MRSRRAEEISIYSWLRFCTVKCRPTARGHQFSHLRSDQDSNSDLRGGRQMSYHCYQVRGKQDVQVGQDSAVYTAGLKETTTNFLTKGPGFELQTPELRGECVTHYISEPTSNAAKVILKYNLGKSQMFCHKLDLNSRPQNIKCIRHLF